MHKMSTIPSPPHLPTRDVKQICPLLCLIPFYWLPAAMVRNRINQSQTWMFSISVGKLLARYSLSSGTSCWQLIHFWRSTAEVEKQWGFMRCHFLYNTSMLFDSFSVEASKTYPMAILLIFQSWLIALCALNDKIRNSCHHSSYSTSVWIAAFCTEQYNFTDHTVTSFAILIYTFWNEFLYTPLIGDPGQYLGLTL